MEYIMKAYRHILFDLDGTLTDPGVGITNSVAYALKKYGIPVEDTRELFKFIGPPLHESFEVYYGLSKEEAFTAVEYYREYYRDRGIFENFVYDGMAELLKSLHSRGYMLAVATSKPEVFARQILEHFALSGYFTYIAGSNLDGTRTKKAEVIDYALRSCGVQDTSSAMMIGDREHDILGAKTLGIDSIGVLFGYGSRAELENAQATYIAEHVEDIQRILAGCPRTSGVVQAAPNTFME